MNTRKNIKRIGVTGHRGLPANILRVEQILHRLHVSYPEAEFGQGGAEGFDYWVWRWCRRHGFTCYTFLPNYDEYRDRPRYAPIARNIKIMDWAAGTDPTEGGCIAFWDGRRKGGTYQAREYALSIGLPVLWLDPKDYNEPLNALYEPAPMGVKVPKKEAVAPLELSTK